jgi:hypothetical protein
MGARVRHPDNTLARSTRAAGSYKGTRWRRGLLPLPSQQTMGVDEAKQVVKGLNVLLLSLQQHHLVLCHQHQHQ